MEKIVHPCDVPMWNGKKYPMFCKIKFENGRLSITGVIGPTVHGNAMGGCGQIDSEFYHPTIRKDGQFKPHELRFSKGWTTGTFYKFIRYWHEWHLNDMHSNCIHQEKMGITYDKFPWHVCSECGFKIGSAWTMREVPGWVILFLFSLPDTDRTPNWV